MFDRHNRQLSNSGELSRPTSRASWALLRIILRRLDWSTTTTMNRTAKTTTTTIVGTTTIVMVTITYATIAWFWLWTYSIWTLLNARKRLTRALLNIGTTMKQVIYFSYSLYPSDMNIIISSVVVIHWSKSDFISDNGNCQVHLTLKEHLLTPSLHFNRFLASLTLSRRTYSSITAFTQVIFCQLIFLEISLKNLVIFSKTAFLFFVFTCPWQCRLQFFAKWSIVSSRPNICIRPFVFSILQLLTKHNTHIIFFLLFAKSKSHSTQAPYFASIKQCWFHAVCASNSF